MKTRYAMYGAGLIVAIGLAAGAVGMVNGRVSNGNVGVKISASGKVISKTPLSPGWHFALTSKIVEYPVRMTQADYNKSGKTDNTITVSTSDGKRVDVEVKVNYHADSDKVISIYKKFGTISQDTMEMGWLRTQTQNVLRDQYVKHSILEILTGKATTLETEIIDQLKDKFETQGYVLDDVTLGIPDVDSETKKSIDQIISATQANEKAKKDAETAITNANKDAEVKKTEADAKLYASQKEAEANKVLSSSVTDELVRYKEALAREKHGWVTVTGSEGTIVDK